jgi:hypothetical protein
MSEMRVEAAEEVGMSPSEVLHDPPEKPVVEKAKPKKQSKPTRLRLGPRKLLPRPPPRKPTTLLCLMVSRNSTEKYAENSFEPYHHWLF